MPQDNDNLKKLYDNVSQEYNLPDYKTFQTDMQDDTKRQKLYSAISKNYQLPDFGTFSNDMGLKKKGFPNVSPSLPDVSKVGGLQSDVANSQSPSNTETGIGQTQQQKLIPPQTKPPKLIGTGTPATDYPTAITPEDADKANKSLQDRQQGQTQIQPDLETLNDKSTEHPKENIIPEKVKSAYQQAYEYSKNKNYDQSNKVIDKALDLKPLDPYLLELQAHNKMQQGDYNAALGNYNVIYSQNPKRLDILDKRAYANVQEANYPQGITDAHTFTQAYSKYTTNDPELSDRVGYSYGLIHKTGDKVGLPPDIMNEAKDKEAYYNMYSKDLREDAANEREAKLMEGFPDWFMHNMPFLSSFTEAMEGTEQITQSKAVAQKQGTVAGIVNAFEGIFKTGMGLGAFIPEGSGLGDIAAAKIADKLAGIGETGEKIVRAGIMGKNAAKLLTMPISFIQPGIMKFNMGIELAKLTPASVMLPYLMQPVSSILKVTGSKPDEYTGTEKNLVSIADQIGMMTLMHFGKAVSNATEGARQGIYEKANQLYTDIISRKPTAIEDAKVLENIINSSTPTDIHNAAQIGFNANTKQMIQDATQQLHDFVNTTIKGTKYEQDMKDNPEQTLQNMIDENKTQLQMAPDVPQPEVEKTIAELEHQLQNVKTIKAGEGIKTAVIPGVEDDNNKKDENDKKDETRLPSEVGEGEKPLEVKPNEGTGDKKVETSGVVQTPPEEVKPKDGNLIERDNKYGISHSSDIPEGQNGYKEVKGVNEVNPVKGVNEVNPVKGVNEVNPVKGNTVKIDNKEYTRKKRKVGDKYYDKNTNKEIKEDNPLYNQVKKAFDIDKPKEESILNQDKDLKGEEKPIWMYNEKEFDENVIYQGAPTSVSKSRFFTPRAELSFGFAIQLGAKEGEIRLAKYDKNILKERRILDDELVSKIVERNGKKYEYLYDKELSKKEFEKWHSEFTTDNPIYEDAIKYDKNINTQKDIRNAVVKKALETGKYQDAIKEGRMTANDAKTIIESSGLEVPKDILDMIDKPKEEVKPKEDIIDFINKSKLDKNIKENYIKFETDANDKIQKSREVLYPEDEDKTGEPLNTDTGEPTSPEQVPETKVPEVKENTRAGLVKAAQQIVKPNDPKIPEVIAGLNKELAVGQEHTFVSHDGAERIGKIISTNKDAITIQEADGSKWTVTEDNILKEKGATVETRQQVLEKVKKNWKALGSSGISADPKVQAQKLVDLHKSLIEFAGKAISDGVDNFEDFLKKVKDEVKDWTDTILGKPIDWYAKKAWNEANDKKTYDQDYFEKQQLVNDYKKFHKSQLITSLINTKESKAKLQDATNDRRQKLADWIKENEKRINKLKPGLTSSLLNKINKIKTPTSLDAAINYVEKALKNKEYVDNIAVANNLKGALKKIVKKVPGNIKDALKGVENINLKLFSNAKVVEFNTAFQKILDGIRSKGGLVPDTEIKKTISDLLKDQDVLQEQNRKEQYQSLIDNGRLDPGVSYEDFINPAKDINEALDNDEVKISKQTEELQGLVSQTKNDINSSDQSEWDDRQKEQWKILRDIKVGNLKLNELKQYYLNLNNIAVNDNFSGVDDFIHVTNKYMNANPGDVDFKPENIHNEGDKEKATANIGSKIVQAISFIPKMILKPLYQSYYAEQAMRRLIGTKEGERAVSSILMSKFFAPGEARKFLETTASKLGTNFETLGRLTDKMFTKADKKDINVAFGKATTEGGMLAQKEALSRLKDLSPDKKKFIAALQQARTEMSGYNWNLMKDLGEADGVEMVVNYMRQLYKIKDSNEGKLYDFAKKFTTSENWKKHRFFPTYADAVGQGFEGVEENPVWNLLSETNSITNRVATKDLINHIRSNNWGFAVGSAVADTDKGGLHEDWKKVNDPLFNGLLFHPEVAKLINNLNEVPTGLIKGLRNTASVFQYAKFAISGFHTWNILKGAIANSGYKGVHEFIQGYGEDKSWKADPMNIDYIKHGGTSHNSSVETAAIGLFRNLLEKQWVHNFTTSPVVEAANGFLFKHAYSPLSKFNPISPAFVSNLFENVIPRVKFETYKNAVMNAQDRLGRPLEDYEKIEAVKRIQNQFGEMNEKLFGRSGVVTALNRIFFQAPGYGEGNFLRIFNAAKDLGMLGKSIVTGNVAENFNERGLHNISFVMNSLVMAGTVASIGTLVNTGKFPDAPKNTNELRDLFKIKLGSKDKLGNDMYVDMLSYEKDDWSVWGNILAGKFDRIAPDLYKRFQGMESSQFTLGLSLVNSVFKNQPPKDWTGKDIWEKDDDFHDKMGKMLRYVGSTAMPISLSVVQQNKAQGRTGVGAIAESVLGFRPTKSEAVKQYQLSSSQIYDYTKDRATKHQELEKQIRANNLTIPEAEEQANEWNKKRYEQIEEELEKNGKTFDDFPKFKYSEIFLGDHEGNIKIQMIRGKMELLPSGKKFAPKDLKPVHIKEEYKKPTSENLTPEQIRAKYESEA